jgi:L-rhamnose-H+ transport protein
MPSVEWRGLLSVITAGVFQGSFMLPMKWTTGWAWENTWLVFACTAYLFCPWLLVVATVPGAFTVYSSTPAPLLLKVMTFGIAWGAGAITFGLGVAELGLALGYTVILGLASTLGTIVPLLLFHEGTLSHARVFVTGISLSVMLLGVAVSSFAGKWRELGQKSRATTSYRKGVVLCLASGLLSACGNLGFVVGGAIIDRAQDLGVPPYLAPNVVWALLTLPLFICNAGYSLVLMQRNGTACKFATASSPRYFAFGLTMGLLWMGGFWLYGLGARRLGDLGPSLGWAILMSTMVLAANVLGFASGEWNAAPRAAKRQLGQGVLLLLLAIIGLGYANHMR